MTPSYAAATVATSDYLPWVRVAADSFLRHNPGATYHVLFFDRVPSEQLRGEDRFVPVSIHDTDLSAEEFSWLRLIYNNLELSCALKPVLIRKALQTAETVLYIDADMCVYDSLAYAADVAAETGVLLSPHALSPRGMPGVEQEDVLHHMGMYNAGFLGIGQRGRPFLDWWWSKLRRECFAVERNVQYRFLDQLWLDLVPAYFPAAVDRTAGTNVARWNLFQRELSTDGEGFMVAGEPLRLFHFSALDPAEPWHLRHDDHRHPSVDPMRSPALRTLVDEYVAALIAAGWQPNPERHPERSLDGITLTLPVRAAIGTALMESERRTIAPQIDAADDQAVEDWLRAPVTESGISWFLYGLHRAFPAVRSAFPNVPGPDEARYLQWAAADAVTTGIIPAALSRTSPAASHAAPAATNEPPPGEAGPASLRPPTKTAARIQPSEQLLRFTAEVANERQSILEFVMGSAAEIPAGSRLLDVGAGNSPYRELFTHVRYESNDWQHSMHPGARAVDHVGPAHAIPVGDGEYDAVLCTQVLEHVPNPRAVLAEIGRVLRPGGRLHMTVPLTWELHEQPFDFFRYTPHGLYSMLSDAGFTDLDIRARNDSFSTVAQLLRNLPSTLGSYPDGKDQLRAQTVAPLAEMANRIDTLRQLDSRWTFPLGMSVRATNGPRTPVRTRPRTPDIAARARSGLEQARGFVFLCFASDILTEPGLLTDYARHFGGEDNATLVIYAPDTDAALASRALTDLVSQADLDGPDSPDMIALPYRERADESALASVVDAVLALRPPWGAFAGLPWTHSGNLDEFHRLVSEPA